MEAVRYALSFVRKGEAPPVPTLADDVGLVSGFLVAHAESLTGRADKGNAADATFRGKASEARFRNLRDGKDEDFLETAHQLSTDLVAAMSRVRAAEGVLVCVTFVGPRSRCAGALKLQIISDHGATLTRLNSGEVRLSAVKDVLDRPGDLQKGVVYPDLRATSSAVVGDKVNVRDANYFVEAMGLRLDERDKDAFGLLAQATADVVGVGDAPRVVRALSRARAHSVDEVLAEAAETEPLLDEATQARIIEELANRDRPVRQVDTQAALKRTIRVGDVTISGPARDLEDVATRPHPDGGREVVLRLDGDWHDRYHT